MNSEINITTEKVYISRPWSEERKRKFREKMVGHLVLLETREKIRQSKLGKKLSEEHKKKISNSRRGVKCPSMARPMTAERKAKLRAGFYRKMTPEYRKFHSERMKRWNIEVGLTEEQKQKRYLGSLNWLGKHHSSEVKEKLRKLNTGKKLSETTKAKIAQASIGRKLTEEAKEKLRQIQKGKKRPEWVIERMRIGMGNRRPETFKSTNPEIAVENGLISAGISFRKHWYVKDPTMPKKHVNCDFFIEPNVVIFVDGCYWHSCPVCPSGKNPGHSKERISQRDMEINTWFNMNPQWKVIRIWEHEIENDINAVVSRISSAINQASTI